MTPLLPVPAQFTCISLMSDIEVKGLGAMPELISEEAARRSILAETAKIGWHELQRFFASGHAVAVASELDLIEVAYQMSQDNETLVASWMDDGKINPVSDLQATEWFEANALMWSVVIKPWILVQPVIQKK